MVNNEHYVEKSLCNDAVKIVIDEEFKCDLKNRIMFGDKYNITELPKHKNNFKQSKYFKIAASFVIGVFVSGTIFKVIDVPTKGKPDVITPISSAKNLSEDNSGKTNVPLRKDAVASINNGDNLLSIAKGNEGSESNAVDDTMEKHSKEIKVVISKNTGKVNSVDKDVVINKSPAKNGGNVDVSTDVSKPINVPNMPNLPAVEVKIDKTIPTLQVSFDQPVITTNNHKLVPIKSLVTTKDLLSEVASFKLVSIVSNQPANGTQDGNTEQDIQSFEIGTADTDFLVRAETNGNEARVYTVTYKAIDNAGNSVINSENIVVSKK